MEGNRCSLDFSSGTVDACEFWRAKGSYTEELGENSKVCSVALTLEDKPQACPRSTFDVAVEKVEGEAHEALVCEGVRCPLRLGFPACEIAAMMRPTASSTKPAVEKAGYSTGKDATLPVATPEPKVAPEGFLSLYELRNPDIWKARGVDPACRETYLSEESFFETFGVSKADFAKMPKWKRDKAKMGQGLF
eukprot:gnl/TRDRNA2_/TRDRNA2_146123_c2_seq1.p1 gnl/TRDRNA2_/TRDRNA2_146123_c2~~gnl/TRDRNA2_/TRDRNA2_146123_c2_seq1.p1  ORF type:complete len:209 (+),score=46.79 gnl/TRDRNA2_/TRDRNA2_146123_c2_seq1:53-628(+)